MFYSPLIQVGIGWNRKCHEDIHSSQVMHDHLSEGLMWMLLVQVMRSPDKFVFLSCVLLLNESINMIKIVFALPGINIAPARKPSQEQTIVPTPVFQLSGSAAVYRYHHEILSASTWLDFKGVSLGISRITVSLEKLSSRYSMSKFFPNWVALRIFEASELTSAWNIEYDGIWRVVPQVPERRGFGVLSQDELRCAWISCAKTSLVACSILIT